MVHPISEILCNGPLAQAQNLIGEGCLQGSIYMDEAMTMAAKQGLTERLILLHQQGKGDNLVVCYIIAYNRKDHAMKDQLKGLRVHREKEDIYIDQDAINKDLMTELTQLWGVRPRQRNALYAKTSWILDKHALQYYGCLN